MEKWIDVLPIGTKVLLAGEGRMPAEITAICIRHSEYMTYECVWWNGQKREVEWITPNEIGDYKTLRKTRIGMIIA